MNFGCLKISLRMWKTFGYFQLMWFLVYGNHTKWTPSVLIETNSCFEEALQRTYDALDLPVVDVICEESISGKLV